ncbi:MAG TPA: porin family protein [Terracidiphilus sp.]|nr:porin family protein [Terracidiphilus sp.]
MRWKFAGLPLLVLFLCGAALHARAQVAYSAREGKLPFSVGFGVANFSDDWGTKNPRQVGLTLWADWRIPHLPPKLDGLGIEFEGRDVNYATPDYLPGHRMTTGLAGPMYEFRRQSRVRPFVKYLMGIGNLDFPNKTNYQQDTRVVFAPAGGADVRLWSRFSVRGEYEYQMWHAIFGPHDLTPQGFTFGVLYDFGRMSQ